MYYLFKDNISFLQQAIDLLGQLDDSAFSEGMPPLSGSGIGPHLRHCLDHYECFLNGVSEGYINYDQRSRDPDVESSVTKALKYLKELQHRLSDVSRIHPDTSLRIHMDCGTQDTAAAEKGTGTTVARELQFLVSHTVHHYAIISMLCRHKSIPLPDGFGVAPSTLKYEQQQQSTQCAQ